EGPPVIMEKAAYSLAPGGGTGQGGAIWALDRRGGKDGKDQPHQKEGERHQVDDAREIGQPPRQTAEQQVAFARGLTITQQSIERPKKTECTDWVAKKSLRIGPGKRC